MAVGMRVNSIYYANYLDEVSAATLRKVRSREKKCPFLWELFCLLSSKNKVCLLFL